MVFYPKLDNIPYSPASEKYSEYWEYYTKFSPYNLNKPYIVELARTRLVMRPFVPECLRNSCNRLKSTTLLSN